MLSSNTAAGRSVRRLTESRPVPTNSPGRRVATATIAALLASLPLAGLAAAQQYGQQPYGDPNTQYPAYGQQDPQQVQDPPSRVARLSLAQGTVSVQPASAQDFSPAEVNYPLTSGDRLWSDAGSQAELQLGPAAVRLGQQTDLTVTGLTDTLAQFGLAQGSVHLRTFSLDQGTTTELDTPNGAVTVLQPGDLRVDVYPGNNLTVFTLLSGAAQVDAQGFSQQLRPGESLQVTGTDPVSARDVRRPRGDGLDGFSFNQDNAYQASLAAEDGYVSGDTIGASDLSGYGDWNSDADYGAVWFPRSVAVGWQPYRYGHWAYVGPWGWTWVAAEPWGFAPFHYGRWNRFGDRWGWIPGPRVIRPIYSPALVAFVGGGPGAGVTAWFPLGPREPFQPWYRSSDRYVTRVNVTNIYNRNTVEVRNTYFNAGRGPSPFRFDPSRQYINRPATIAVPQGVFAGGRPVHNAELRGDGRQFAGAPVLQRPMVSPDRSMVSPGQARALPPQLARPQWRMHNGGPGYQGQQGSQGYQGQQGGPGQGGRNGQDFRGGGQPGPAAQPNQPGQGTPDRMQRPPMERAPAGPAGPVQVPPNQINQVQQPRYASPHPPLTVQPTQPVQPGQVDQRGQQGRPDTSERMQRAPVERAPAGPSGPVQLQPGPVQRPQPSAPSGQPDSGYRGGDRPERGGQPGSYNPQQPTRTPPPQAPAQTPVQNTPSQPAQPAPAQQRPQPSAPQNVQPQPNQGFRGRQPDTSNQPQPVRTAPPANSAPTPDSPRFNRNEPQQFRPNFDQQRQGNTQQPGNSAPQNRPAAPPMQSIPRPAPQAQPQPQAQPNRPAPPPQPAAQPQSVPKPK